MKTIQPTKRRFNATDYTSPKGQSEIARRVLAQIFLILVEKEPLAIRQVAERNQYCSTLSLYFGLCAGLQYGVVERKGRRHWPGQMHDIKLVAGVGFEPTAFRL